ncbi:MAG: diacylglycerol kinase family protein [Pseudomonadota bacterium]
MSLKALINTASGNIPADAESLLTDALGSRLERSVTCTGLNLHDALDDIQMRPEDTLIVWGGDGTVSAALTASIKTGASIIPLPGGTMNLLHGRVHGQNNDWRETLNSALDCPSKESLTYAQVNGTPAYVAVMAGRLTHLSQSREALREKSLVRAVQDVVDTDALSLETSLVAKIDTECLPATAAAAFLPEATVGAHLDVGIIDPDTLFDLAATSLSAALQNWRTASGMTFRQSETLRLESASSDHIDVLIDGEQTETTSPIKVVICSGDVFVRSAQARP